MPLKPLIVPFGYRLKEQYRNGLVGHWKMNVGGVLIPDLSDSNPKNNGTRTNYNWTATSGWAGQGDILDGVNDYVDAGDPSSIDGLSSITVSAWFKPITASGNKVVIAKWGSVGGYQFVLAYSNDSNYKMSFGVRTGSTGLNGSTQIVTSVTVVNNTTKWYHLVGVYNGSTTKIYIDGVEDNSAVGSGAINSAVSSNIIIGAYSPIINAWINGLIDDVRIFNRALSADEVAHSCFQQEDEWDLGLDDDIDVMQGIPQKMNAYRQMRA